MDLIYKIYSVYLYDNQLNHQFVFLFNRKRSFTGELGWDAPYDMFGNSISASSKIYNMDKSDPLFKEKSIQIMKTAAKKSNTPFIESSDFIVLKKLKTLTTQDILSMKSIGMKPNQELILTNTK